MHHFKCHSKELTYSLKVAQYKYRLAEKSKASETSEALQYGKPPKNDPHAAPKDRKGV